MQYQYNDGGRSAVFNTPGNNDCVTRAIAILTGRPYMEIWGGIIATGTVKKNGSVLTFNPKFQEYAQSLGLTWVPITNHLKDIRFPKRAAAQLNGHMVAIIDGVMHDTYNPSPAGLKTCHGFWCFKPSPTDLYDVCNPDTGAVISRAPLTWKSAETMQRLMFNNYNKTSIIKPHGL